MSRASASHQSLSGEPLIPFIERSSWSIKAAVAMLFLLRSLLARVRLTCLRGVGTFLTDCASGFLAFLCCVGALERVFEGFLLAGEEEGGLDIMCNKESENSVPRQWDREGFLSRGKWIIF